MATNEHRKIMFLVGEGNFSFTKCIISNENYNEYDIIATEYRSENDLNKHYSDNLKSLKSNDSYGKRLFVLFEIDIKNCKWKDIFQECYPNDEIRRPYLIQFNFPWYVDCGVPSEIANSFLEFATENLEPDGLIKLGIVGSNSDFFDRYGDKVNKLYNGKSDTFNLIENVDFCKKYPNYTHVSSKPEINLQSLIQNHGRELAFKLKSDKL